MAKKNTTLVDDLPKTPDEIKEAVSDAVSQTAEQARQVLDRSRPALPRVAVIAVVLLGVGLGLVLLRRRS